MKSLLPWVFVHLQTCGGKQHSAPLQQNSFQSSAADRSINHFLLTLSHMIFLPALWTEPLHLHRLSSTLCTEPWVLQSQTSIKLLLLLPQQLTSDQRRIISRALPHEYALFNIYYRPGRNTHRAAVVHRQVKGSECRTGPAPFCTQHDFT